MTKTTRNSILKWMDKVIAYKHIHYLNEDIGDISVFNDQTHVKGIDLLAEACGNPIQFESWDYTGREDYHWTAKLMYHNHLFYCLCNQNERAYLEHNENIITLQED